MKKIIISVTLLMSLVGCNTEDEFTQPIEQPVVVTPPVEECSNCTKINYYQKVTMNADFYRTLNFEYIKTTEEPCTKWSTTNGRVLFGGNGGQIYKTPEYPGEEYSVKNFGFYSVTCEK